MFQRHFLPFVCAFCVVICASIASAAVVQGRVTDPLGAAIPNATVTLIAKGKVVASTTSQSDGSYQIRNNSSGRFYVVVASNTFKQITTQSFYAAGA